MTGLACWRLDRDFAATQHALMLTTPRKVGVADGDVGNWGRVVPVGFTVDPAGAATVAAAHLAIDGQAGLVITGILKKTGVALALDVEFGALLRVEEEAAERRGIGLAGGDGEEEQQEQGRAQHAQLFPEGW